ncbi:MAG: hypothetical protein WCZ47_02610 [Bacilli bacterium]|nr:hypothetical protein [Erysipelotrichia bacterium]
MKRRNIFTTFLISIATVFMVLGYNILSKNNVFTNLKAEDDYYEMGIVDGGFELSSIYDDSSGILSNGYMEFFYLSHDKALEEEGELHLKAKDENTPGVLCNQTVINGIISVTVKFSGGPLYAIATSTFAERTNYVVGDELTHNTEKAFSGDDLGYLLILAPSTDITVAMTDVIVKYRCEHDTDENFFYAPGVNRYTGARSWGANRKMLHDYIEFTTDPKPSNNNYSVGKTDPEQDYADCWYRWNGVSLRNHYLDGEERKYDGLPFGEFASNKFEVICSVMVEPRVFYDVDAWFSVAPWVALNKEGNVGFGDNPEKLEPIYMQSYIGNDNYDPLGNIRQDRTDTYTGRFYTTFSAGGGGYSYGFVDPDEATLVDGSMTLRAAYAQTTLPFFNVRFLVDGNSYSVYINGLEVLHEEDAFYDNYDGEKYTIDNMALHGVNYGLKDGTAGDASSEYDPYRLTYLNPVVRDLSEIV